MNTKSKNKLVFLPLGGTGEIGMNMNCYGYGSHIDDMKWLLVDVGITFGLSLIHISEPTRPY